MGFLFVFARGVIQYRSYPVATKIEYHTSSHIQFPSVTLCNHNFIRKSFIDAQTTPGLHKAIRSLNPLNNNESKVFDAREIERMKSANMTNIDIAGAHQIHDMFTGCSFSSKNTTLFPCRLYHSDWEFPPKSELKISRKYLDLSHQLIISAFMYCLNYTISQYWITSRHKGCKSLGLSHEKKDPQNPILLSLVNRALTN